MQGLTVNTYIQGTSITIATKNPFTTINGTIIDPDRVWIAFQVDGISSETYTFHYDYGVGDTTNTIQRQGLGLYSATFDTMSYPTGVWNYSIACEPVSTIAHDTTKTKVRNDYSLIVISGSFPIAE
jgi:hypothetical protein